MKKKLSGKKLHAYTLTEVLVVLIIIGVLVLLALPNLLPLITKAKSTEAKIQLEHVHTLAKSYYFEHSSYPTKLAELGFEQERLTTEGGKANYRLEMVESSANKFVARATSVVDFDGDGTFDVWEIDQEKNLKETVKD